MCIHVVYTVKVLHCMYTLYVQYTHCLYKLHVHTACTMYTLPVHTACTHGMYTVYTLYVQCTHLHCLYTLHLHTACTMHNVHTACTAYTLHVQCIRCLYTLHVQCTHCLYTLHVHTTWARRKTKVLACLYNWRTVRISVAVLAQKPPGKKTPSSQEHLEHASSTFWGYLKSQILKIIDSLWRRIV